VVSTAGAAGQAIAAGKTARAQEKAIRVQRERVLEENRDAAGAELFDQMRSARREQARIRTAAGEAGLGLNGGSIEALLFDSAMQMELQGSRTLANLESRNAATDAETESALSQVQRPTLLGAGLQVAGAAASGWAGIQNSRLAVQRAGEVRPD
jgi:hypothetical protein